MDNAEIINNLAKRVLPVAEPVRGRRGTLNHERPRLCRSSGAAARTWFTRWLAVLTFIAAVPAGAASAQTTYDVYATDGSETLTGYITTNGSGYIGGIGENQEVFQWSFQASGPIGFSILWDGPYNVTVQGDPTLFATTTSIDVVNNNSPAPIYGSTGGWAVSFQGESSGVAAIALDYDHNVDDFVTEYTLYAPNPIATIPSPVPVPASAWLLLVGLGGLGAYVRRRRVARGFESQGALPMMSR